MSEINVNLIKFAGMLLGDGYIDQKGRVCFKHSKIQKEYADYKAKKLFEYFNLKSNAYQLKKGENSYSTNDNYLISCHPKNWTKIIRSEWYLNSTKNIPCEILEQFGVEEWSFLYQDDGRLNKISHVNSLQNGVRVRKECKPFVNRYEICLGYPSNEQLNALIKSLSNLEIDATILSRKDGQRNIAISRAASKIKFYELIKPYIHKSMEYKINISPTLTYSM